MKKFFCLMAAMTMLLSALLGCYRLMDGVIDMIHLRFTPDSLLVVTFLISCVDGVITGYILSIGRIVGESAALLFTAGFAHALNGFVDALFTSGSTLTVALYMYATEGGEFGVAFAIAAILMVLTVLINFAATLVQKHFAKRRSL